MKRIKKVVRVKATERTPFDIVEHVREARAVIDGIAYPESSVRRRLKMAGFLAVFHPGLPKNFVNELVNDPAAERAAKNGEVAK